MGRFRAGRARAAVLVAALALAAAVIAVAVTAAHQRGVVRGDEATWSVTVLPGARLAGFDAGRLLLHGESGLVVYDRGTGRVRQRVDGQRIGVGAPEGGAGRNGIALAPGGVLHTTGGTLVYAAESGPGWRLPGRTDRTYLLGLDARALVVAVLRCRAETCRAQGVGLRDGAVRWTRPAALAVPYFSRGTAEPHPAFGAVTAVGRPPFVPFGPSNTYLVLEVATGAVRGQVVSGSAYLAGDAVLFTGRGECGLVVAAATVREPRWPVGRPSSCRVLAVRSGTAYVGDAAGLVALDLAGGTVRRLPDGLGNPADTTARVDGASAKLYARARRRGAVEVLDVRTGGTVGRYRVGRAGFVAVGDGAVLVAGPPSFWQRRLGGAGAGRARLTVYQGDRAGARLVRGATVDGGYPLDRGQALVIDDGRAYLLSA